MLLKAVRDFFAAYQARTSDEETARVAVLTECDAELARAWEFTKAGQEAAEKAAQADKAALAAGKPAEPAPATPADPAPAPASPPPS